MFFRGGIRTNPGDRVISRKVRSVEGVAERQCRLEPGEPLRRVGITFADPARLQQRQTVLQLERIFAADAREVLETPALNRLQLYQISYNIHMTKGAQNIKKVHYFEAVKAVRVHQ